jgi:hypothetical protein
MSALVKPNHRGRVIKDVKPVMGLEPLSRGPPQPPVTKRVSSGDISADGTSLGRPDSMKKRVHELEMENNKLRRSLDEAEQSIKTYRNFLSAKSSTSNVSVSVQTDFASANRQRDPDAALRSENASLRAQVSTLQQSIADVTASMNTLTQAKIAAERASAVKIEELLAQIDNLRALKNSAIVSASPNHIPLLKTLKKKSAHHNRQFFSTQDTVREALNDFNHHMRHTVELIVNEISRHEKSVHARHIAMTPRKSQLTSPMKSHHQIKASSQEMGCSPMARREQVDSGTDPLSPYTAKGLEHSGSHTRIHKQPLDPSTPSTPTTSSSSDQHGNSRGHKELDRMKDDTIKMMMESLQSATEKYESEKLTLEAQASRDAEQVALLSDRLLAASREFQLLLNKFGKEMNAVKHMAHCKDLVRIAGLRELGLEKDRLVNEMKYAK